MCTLCAVLSSTSALAYREDKIDEIRRACPLKLCSRFIGTEDRYRESCEREKKEGNEEGTLNTIQKYSVGKNIGQENTGENTTRKKHWLR